MLSKHQLKELHGKDYVELFEKRHSDFRIEHLIASINLAPGCNVADFGCGNGMLLPLLTNRVGSYTGIDFSREFIESAEKRKKMLSISNAEFICDDINEFCSKNRSTFDVAFALDFSEHVYDDEWLSILQAINYSLKEGGRLYIHTPNSDFFVERLKKNNIILKQFPEHIAVRNVKENCCLLEKAGFEITRVKLIGN